MAYTIELMLQTANKNKLFEQLVFIMEAVFLLHMRLDNIVHKHQNLPLHPLPDPFRKVHIPKSNHQIGSLKMDDELSYGPQAEPAYASQFFSQFENPHNNEITIELPISPVKSSGEG
jgi:hypothetical protein